MQIEESKINGFKIKLVTLNNLRIGIATEIGPRILFLASETKPEFNVFGILPEVKVKTAEGFWKIYGGHRLWSSPEATPRSYSLDDNPVKLEIGKNKITILGNPEPANSIQKKITIVPNDKKNSGVQVIHTIKNIGRRPLQVACWALSVMRRNGVAIIPIKPAKVDQAGLLPDRHISLWLYTSLADKRLTFLDEYILVKQNPKIAYPVKIATLANPSWVAYWVKGLLFIKQIERKSGEYPDYGCNVEVYTNNAMLETETLGLLQTVNPNESIQHTEWWNIFPARKKNLQIQTSSPTRSGIKIQINR